MEYMVHRFGDKGAEIHKKFLDSFSKPTSQAEDSPKQDGKFILSSLIFSLLTSPDLTSPYLTSAPSNIKGLKWSAGYSAEPHKCDPKYDPECPGQECRYNVICGGGCDRVLSRNVYVYHIERSGKELAVCNMCFDDLCDIMLEEGGWTESYAPLTRCECGAMCEGEDGKPVCHNCSKPSSQETSQPTSQ
jgi:hypothetical protein